MTTTADPQDATDLEIALALAEVADDITMRHFLSDDLDVQLKADESPVTLADKAAERALRDAVATLRPGDGVFGEEFGDEGGGERRWIIDPIDGTKNYLRGVPIWATLIGLQVGDVITTGVVSAPAMARRWWASTGEGAWTQDVTGRVRRIRASQVDRVEQASFSFSDAVGWDEVDAAAGLARLVGECWRTRAYGDFLSHVLVAEGAVDIAAEPDLMPWDLSALVPIIVEAGGRVTDFGGADLVGRDPSGRSVLSTNTRLHDFVLAILRERSAQG